MKKLDKLLLKSFVGPLFVTFFVALFVFDMQFFYVYMDELIGKGLGPLLVTKLLVLMSATMVTAALPLGVLLASIMTFGSLGENYELVAIKSSGISLLRFMRPIMALMVLISVGAFLFNNYVIPVANLKAFSLLYDLRHSKPTLNIKAGQFNNDIDLFSIKVGGKDKDGQGIRNVIIYDQTSGIGNDNIVMAKQGVMRPDAANRGLVFHLQDGWRYQEGLNNRRNGLQHDEQVRMHFQRWDKMIDLTGMGLTHTNEELFKNGYQMQDVIQLSSSIDSIRKNRSRELEQGEWYFKPYITAYVKTEFGDTVRRLMRSPAVVHDTVVYGANFLLRVPDSQRAGVAGTAASQVRNIKSALDGTAGSYAVYSRNIDKHYVELHKRFTLSFACILMFLIGAPLGSIIRKGGLGLPIVVAIVFFLIYYLLSSFGEKGAISGDFSPLVGVWMSTAMLLPVAVVLIIAARNDSPVFSRDWYLRRWHGVRTLFGSKKSASPLASKTTAQL